MTIAITTPTGHVGSHVARLLVQAGERPRLLLRDPDRLESELREHVDLAVGDRPESGRMGLHPPSAGAVNRAVIEP